ncbi:mitotic checkpoint protein domain-containing protein [Ditylenchus destructor]|uniref:Mitotic checkpoint protein domain-containing protein n=1 Tax=Ditylenchus destructor TaxID=166010 RepID=A0AAD4N325_9BILA|nr:mitotic checkpoint protein domain-containing protein [Ditylenchus destructor]
MFGSDNINDISRVFAQKVEKRFNKDFGKKPVKPITDVKTNELNIKLIEAEEKIASLNRTVANKDKEIERLKGSAKSFADKLDQLAEQNKAVKQEAEKRKRESMNLDDNKLKERLLLDDYRTALSKYVTWYNYAEKQMALMKQFFQEHGGWTEENRYKIYFAYKEVAPISITDDQVADLCKTSVFHYQGIEDIESISEFEQSLKFQNISTQTDAGIDNLESGFIQHSEEPESRSQGSQSRSISMTAEEIRSLQQMERIQLLESKVANMESQNKVLSVRARHNAFLEEQKIDLEQQLHFLKQHNDNMIMENEKLRALTANIGGGNITQIIAKNEELSKRIVDMESEKANVPSTAEESKKIAQFFKNKYQKELDELKNKLAQYEPLHPSDTTRVVRFQGYNLLDEAHEEHLVNQAALAAVDTSNTSAKRRKLDATSSGEDYSGASGSNVEEDSEQIKDLRRQLKRVTREYEQAAELQKNLALQYRQLVTLLTGYQIKMREEGFCEVGNVMDQGGMFCFQKKEDNSIDLLDNDCAQKWKPVVENYLAKYNSIPAFLAAVTLNLVENDVSFGSTFFNITRA